MEDSQKKHKNPESKQEKEKKNTIKQKKSEDPPKITVKKRYSFKRRICKKLGEARNEYKRDVKHLKKIKNIFNNQVFFKKKESHKIMMRRFKNEGFFLVHEAEKNKKLEMQKATKKYKERRRNQKHLCPEGRKNGTRKDMC